MKRDYVPALRFNWLTPWCDRFMARLYSEACFKGEFVGQADLEPGQRVLDLGCGTATLTLII
jgi:ubiquinone/menaquinone biosynthesis C-methylase UbiE